MRPSPVLLATSALLAFLGQSSVRAEEIALTFDLPAVHPNKAEAAPQQTADVAAEQIPDPAANQGADQPADVAALLPVPAAAANPPIQSGSSTSVPGKTYGGSESLAMANQSSAAASLLPPPPPLPTALVALVKSEAAPKAEPQPAPKAAKPPLEPIALNFAIAPNAAGLALASAQQAAPETEAAAAAAPEPASLLSIFEGGSESLVARTVGSAEGTRTATGERTPAFYGHVDPGNGVWNLGTFSYQHGAANPEEADVRQLRRLQGQSEIIRRKALDHGIELSLKETLNGIDLANQAPIAALGKGSYVDWLAQARQLGMTGDEAIVWARTRSFLDPDTQRWNAPGLGNNVNSISRDQERRMLAIARSLEAYQAQNPDQPVALTAAPTPDPAPTPAPETPPAAELAPQPEEAVDSFLKLDQAPRAEPSAETPQPGLNFAPGLDQAPQQSAPAAGPSEESTAAAVREGAQNITPPVAAPADAPAQPAAEMPEAPSSLDGAVPNAVVYPPASSEPIEIPSAETPADAIAPTSQTPEGNLQGALPLFDVENLLFSIDT